MKEIETSKGRFVVMADAKPYPFHMYIQQYGCNYFKLSEITELEAIEIVTYKGLPFNSYKDYTNDYNWFHSAIKSLHSLLESQGIEITNNTYIFKV